MGAVVVVHAPVLFGWLDPNPINILSNADIRSVAGPLPGSPFVDPNIGFTSQALGHRSVLDWFSGHAPWWNPYEGVGAPLTGGFQAAAFFPPTLLTFFANGQLYLHMILDVTAGLATFFLLKELGLRRWISTLGGVLFALNGTFAWLGHAPANPVAFLPLLILGIERAFKASGEARSGGWLLVPVAIALSLVAGFPETAYIDGLLAGLWTVGRFITCTSGHRRMFAAKIATGAVIGVLLAAPVIVAVADYLPAANIGLHAHVVDDALSRAASPLLVMPYAFGPIGAYTQYDHTGTIANIWTGGYLNTSILFLALVGLVGRRHRGLRITLAAWVTFALMRVLGVSAAFELTKVVPVLDRTLFSAYSAPSWEFASLLLAIMGLDDLVGSRVHGAWVLAAGLLSLGLTGEAIHIVRSFLGDIRTAPGHELAAKLSAAWAVGVIVILMIGAVGILRRWRYAVPLVSIVMLLDVAGMFVVPELSNPQSGAIDTRLIAFLQGHLGTSRFYTFGAISPNYGSYFGIASINVNDVPEPTLWTHYISTKLDTNSSPLEFTGYVRLVSDGPTPVQEFRDHVANYAWVGVKYVVTSPPVEDLDSLAPPGDLKIAYDDGSYQVLQLTTAAPFFQAVGKSCSLHWSSWNDARVDCARPTRIVRRELYMSGWSASVNGKQSSISQYGGLFESVRVPAGASTVTFSYIPTHETVALWASGVGALGIVAEGCLWWRRARSVSTRRRPRGAWT